VGHDGGGSSKYDLPHAIRAFHRSAFRYYVKHSGIPGRLAAPVVRTGLFLRGEFRVRQALGVPASSAAPIRHPAADPMADAPPAYAEVEQSMQGV
jgi:hypothetical protein